MDLETPISILHTEVGGKKEGNEHFTVFEIEK